MIFRCFYFISYGILSIDFLLKLINTSLLKLINHFHSLRKLIQEYNFGHIHSPSSLLNIIYEVEKNFKVFLPVKENELSPSYPSNSLI